MFTTELKEFFMFFVGGIVVVAGLMELYKYGAEETKRRITIYSIVLTLVVSASIFFGFSHPGNSLMYPAWAVAFWYLQKVVDMRFVRKIVKGLTPKVVANEDQGSILKDPTEK